GVKRRPGPLHSPSPPASSLDQRNTPIHVDASTPASTPRRHAEFSRTRKNGGWRIGRNRAGPVRRDDTHPSRGPASSGNDLAGKVFCKMKEIVQAECERYPCRPERGDLGWNVPRT